MNQTTWDKAFNNAVETSFWGFCTDLFLAKEDDAARQKASDDFKARIQAAVDAKAIALEMFGDADG